MAQGDPFAQVRASMEYQSPDQDGALLAELGHLLVPGNKNALYHLMGMCSLSPAATRAAALILSNELHTPQSPTTRRRQDFDLSKMSESARTVVVHMMLSNSENARGRNDLTAVLAGTVVRAARAARNLIPGRGGLPR